MVTTHAHPLSFYALIFVLVFSNSSAGFDLVRKFEIEGCIFTNIQRPQQAWVHSDARRVEKRKSLPNIHQPHEISILIFGFSIGLAAWVCKARKSGDGGFGFGSPGDTGGEDLIFSPPIVDTKPKYSPSTGKREKINFGRKRAKYFPASNGKAARKEGAVVGPKRIANIHEKNFSLSVPPVNVSGANGDMDPDHGITSMSKETSAGDNTTNVEFMPPNDPDLKIKSADSNASSLPLQREESDSVDVSTYRMPLAGFKVERSISGDAREFPVEDNRRPSDIGCSRQADQMPASRPQPGGTPGGWVDVVGWLLLGGPLWVYELRPLYVEVSPVEELATLAALLLLPTVISAVTRGRPRVPAPAPPASAGESGGAAAAHDPAPEGPPPAGRGAGGGSEAAEPSQGRGAQGA